MAGFGRGYSALEYDVATCARGGRKEHAARLLRKLREAQCEEAVELQIVEGASTPGDGSLPTVEPPKFCVPSALSMGAYPPMA